MIPDFVAKIGPLTTAPMDHAKTGIALALTVAAEGIQAAVTVLDQEGFLLEDVMASDLEEGFEVTYHLSRLEGATRVELRVIVPHNAPNVPTISAIYPGADWHERECYDFFGINFVGHPNLCYLLLPEDSTIHPLVKAAKARKSLADLMPLSYLVDCGLAKPEEEKPATKPAAKPAAKDA